VAFIVQEFVTFGVKIREFYKNSKLAKIPLVILELWAHSTGCSDAVLQLISMQQEQTNTIPAGRSQVWLIGLARLQQQSQLLNVSLVLPSKQTYKHLAMCVNNNNTRFIQRHGVRRYRDACSHGHECEYM